MLLPGGRWMIFQCPRVAMQLMQDGPALCLRPLCCLQEREAKKREAAAERERKAEEKRKAAEEKRRWGAHML